MRGYEKKAIECEEGVRLGRERRRKKIKKVIKYEGMQVIMKLFHFVAVYLQKAKYFNFFLNFFPTN